MMSLIWKTLKIGAGGFVTGIDISPDGSTRLVRTDTNGAFIWNASMSRWDQLCAASRLPSASISFGRYTGVWEIRCAPSAPSIIYMAFLGDVFKSVNRGVSWLKLSEWTTRTMPANGNDTLQSNRVWNPKMAVDPINQDHVILATESAGVWRTTDGGASWTVIASIPTATYGHTVNFDSTSAATGGKTSVVYATVYGGGVYRSADGADTFSLISSDGPGATAKFTNTKMAADGTWYGCTDGNVSPYSAHIWKYAASTWSDITPASAQWSAVIPDPENANRVIVDKAGTINVSLDTGGTWNGDKAKTRTASDVPWLAWTDESYMSSGDIVFDPAVANRLWFAQGIGVWYADIGSTSPSSVEWISQNSNIENLVVNQIIKPPGGAALIAVWDRQLFRSYNQDAYPSQHSVDNKFAAGWSVDYSPFDPNFLVVLDEWSTEKSAKSSNGGATWTTLTAPAFYNVGNYYGGHIAVSTPTNFVWVPVGQSLEPVYTKDGGSTWATCPLPAEYTGINGSGTGGWGAAAWCKRHICDADKVTANKFYLYWADPEHAAGGILVTEDSGDTWTLVNSDVRLGRLTSSATAYHAKLRAVPGNANHLFFTAGADNQAPEFIRSTNGGATWTIVDNVKDVWGFGFGKAADGQSYSTVFIVGKVSNVHGVWQSDDDCTTWVNIGTYPNDNWDRVTTVEGDLDTYGKVYIGMNGSGCVYGSPWFRAPTRLRMHA